MMDVFVLGSYVNANCLSIKRLPVAGESLAATVRWVEHGGKGLNLAVGLHRLGVKLHLLLGIGDDMAGLDLLEWLCVEGLDTRWVLKVGSQSGFGVGLIATDGSNVIVIYPGANALLNASHVQAATSALIQSQLVCAQFEVMDAPILEAFQQARQHHVSTLLNPSPWRMPDSALLALTDILVVNETEAALLFGLEVGQERSLPQWLLTLPQLGWQGKLLVVTLAARGCVAVQQGGQAIHQPAWSIVQVDATGAGDAFVAGLAYAWCKGQTLEAALAFANACGAMVAGRQGVLPALPTLERVAGFMAEMTDSFSS